MTSSPLRPGASMEEELDYYKKQYEQLETDLADFQSSSKDLEEQLERDIETAERNEHKLKEQVEKLNYEVEEWKQKHKQAKTEANSAQNALQKEVTALREGRRQLELRLRDIEVVNDDYERQARNTESSLEDMESKYNVTIERGVMLEEEVKVGEKEREELRIEAQRLRDELGELKVENEITQEKLRKADRVIEKLRQRKPSPPLAVKELRPSQQRPRSPTASEASGVTPASPTASTPPPKSDSMTEASTPPSPPLSDAPAHANGVKSEGKPNLLHKLRGSAQTPDLSATPKPYFPSSSAASRHAPSPAVRKPTRHSRAPSSVTVSSTGTQSATSDPYRSSTSMRPPPSSTRTRLTSTRPSTGSTTSSTPTAAGGAESTTSSTTGAGSGNALPRSDSLHQIKALRGRMQKIEERVHSARSKLPAPQPGTTPAGSMIAPGGGLARTPTKLRGSPAHRMSPSHYQRGSTPTGGSGGGGGGSPSAASQPGGAGLPGSVTLRKSSRMMTPRGSSGIGGAAGAGGGSNGNSRTGSPAAGGHGGGGGGGGGDSFAKRIASGEKLMTAEHHRKISGSGIKRKDGASWAGGKRLSYGLLPRPGGGGIGGPGGGGGYRSPSSSLARPISRTEVGNGSTAAGGRNGTGAGPAAGAAEGRRPASRSSLGLSMSYSQQQQQRPGSRQSGVGGGVDSRPTSRAGGGGRQSMSNTSSSSRPSSSHRPRSSMGGSAATPGSFSSTGGLGTYATVHGTPRGAAAGGGGGHKASASLADIRRRAVAEEQEEVGETY
ncbi:hypothetical protein KC316_g1244 [Hortaea werneckii]|uniref:NUDE domain-containing protein n=2 Tax=Hortaea werneckii TaxID=91943 RepID=A0A3M6YM96_HORWE|nr:hypothetical protein KC324_g2986 [Hortaea werneckii]KAI7594237.1 hypothetical protein KC316_g1244 [Hortaea werneckii]RMY04009.1 hypothetical protein D0868_07168 [Hortaea werneckii]